MDAPKKTRKDWSVDEMITILLYDEENHELFLINFKF